MPFSVVFRFTAFCIDKSPCRSRIFIHNLSKYVSELNLCLMLC
jgi:hypothetical protein